MKKPLFSILFVAGLATYAFAQTKTTTTTTMQPNPNTKITKEHTEKLTSSPTQRVHNTFSKDKKHNGKKVKNTTTVEKTTTNDATK